VDKKRRKEKEIDREKKNIRAKEKRKKKRNQNGQATTTPMMENQPVYYVYLDIMYIWRSVVKAMYSTKVQTT
jgi:hypothetical protein